MDPRQKGVLKTVNYSPSQPWTFFNNLLKVGRAFASPEFTTNTNYKWKFAAIQNLYTTKIYLKFVNCRLAENALVKVLCNIKCSFPSTNERILDGLVQKNIKLEETLIADILRRDKEDPPKESHTFFVRKNDVIKIYEVDNWIAKSYRLFCISCENHAQVIPDEMELRVQRITTGLEQLFMWKKFSDIVLNVSGNKIPAHRVILAARSEVFCTMFETEMKEKISGEVDIDDIDFEVFKELIRFIYTGKVDNLEEMAMDLLILADRYALSDLSAICEIELVNLLTHDNSIEILKLADLCGTNFLKHWVIEFIVENISHTSLKQDFYSLIKSHSSLAQQILEKIASPQRSIRGRPLTELN